MSTDSQTSTSQSISILADDIVVHGGLVRLIGEEHRPACNIHAAALAGLVLPLLGHVAGPVLARMRTDATSPTLRQHYLTALAFHLWWGLVMVTGYVVLWLLGWAVLPLVVLLAGAWVTQTAIVLARIEARRPARYYWYVDLIS